LLIALCRFDAPGLFGPQRGGLQIPPKHNWSVLDIKGIRVENHSQRAGLQLSDCITRAFFTALEPNRYGNIETSHAKRLIGKLITAGQGCRPDRCSGASQGLATNRSAAIS